MTQDSPFAQDSPLSLQGEGWGEGALLQSLNPSPTSTPSEIRIADKVHSYDVLAKSGFCVSPVS
ncbi:hypothetical protein J2T41_004974 [Pseudomonas citronellolis]|nr:hypothetical protein [Pseudomonas citronellolis]MCP1669441.1 hypothetical protein [Pseudomonas citronellolis]MCP1699706.1 hypothetical protein [Pseudomonas citronellolis]MCP1707333.1 hypothetical protein [Pseudomonas citronellolis]MCP1801230.1 hypothetical protein [Pseudomonas citronellolis]